MPQEIPTDAFRSGTLAITFFIWSVRTVCGRHSDADLHHRIDDRETSSEAKLSSTAMGRGSIRLTLK